MACSNIVSPRISCPGKKLELPFDFTYDVHGFTIIPIHTFKSLILKHYRYA